LHLENGCGGSGKFFLGFGKKCFHVLSQELCDIRLRLRVPLHQLLACCNTRLERVEVDLLVSGQR
jgi:hypothetical protein